MTQLLGAPYSYFADTNGAPLAGGKVYTYEAGTTNPKDTYTDSTAGTPNSNPVVLDSAGRASIWLSGSYKIVVKDSLGNVVGNPADNVSTEGSTLTTAIDGSFTLVNTSDASKKLAFDLSGITTGTTRTAAWPDKNGTVAMTSDITGAVKLVTNTPSGSASTAFSSTYITNTYKSYEIRFSGVFFPTGSHLNLVVSTDNGANYLGSNYAWGGGYNANGTWTQASSASDSKLAIDVGVGGAGSLGAAFSGKISFSDPFLTGSLCHFIWECAGGTTTNWGRRASGANSSTTNINNIKLLADSGNITGTFELWGIP